MTVREYLEQAQTLSQRIERDIEDLNEVRELISGVSSPSFTAKVKTSQSGNAKFVGGIERIEKQEEHISREVDLLVELKSQIKGVIDAIPTEGSRLVLSEKYILGCSWDEIKKRHDISGSTLWRWNKLGLEQAVLPDDAIRI